jgi:cytochrome c
MTTNREMLEQKLLEQAQAAIRKLLDELPPSEAITLSDMENLTGRMGQGLMQQTMQELVASQQPPPGDDVECQHCHARMSRRGKRKRHLVTVQGEVQIERQYYVCPACRTGRFPPG